MAETTTASAVSNGTAFPSQDAAGETVAAIAQADTISADEIALYDRQIRLWGVQAQEKIRTANILLVSIKAVANEVAKNLVLAGIGSITVADTEVVTEDDLCSQFFLSEADIGKNRAVAAAPQIQKLNPRVKVNVVTSDVRQEQPEFFARYDVIIATDLDYQSFFTLNAGARLGQKPFYAAGAHGMYGFIFADLVKHEYVLEREKSNRPTQLVAESATRSIVGATTKKENGKVIEMVTKRELYTPINLANTSPLPPDMIRDRRKMRRVTPLLTCIRALWEYQQRFEGRFPTPAHTDLAAFTTIATEKHSELQLPAETLKSDFLRSFLQNMGCELAPVTAFLGGQLAQDVINVLGKREQPIQNLMLFDGEESLGVIYPLHPVFEDGFVPEVPPASNIPIITL
jgi:ubiquitin-like 1-activating enzyme E1 A